MKKFIEWIKAHSNYFKIFFVISVLIIVIAELFFTWEDDFIPSIGNNI
ncbi:hypothetical protein MPTP_1151 [Melissococcus plutonius ATCC 35311]|uniref:Uncharacterized protein n=1 Tax=Melissococcus plutonius (strain ATCC 35311 / DSM 29964 / CIP 104052 / LMG 20360 / NCIMB 702443) TaxID=940190 RepID=F3YAS4_MELPT|nr:hypothetical protein MPTP_1151 [Melissococcus plutonius ATCC 35311]